ncbi:hypothetical protein K3495_g8965 [Podosphaera aphanis]|nr:hypothetical protein K3495_g8965 [Podosphaera aphanis]
MIPQRKISSVAGGFTTTRLWSSPIHGSLQQAHPGPTHPSAGVRAQTRPAGSSVVHARRHSPATRDKAHQLVAPLVHPVASGATTGAHDARPRVRRHGSIRRPRMTPSCATSMDDERRGSRAGQEARGAPTSARREPFRLLRDGEMYDSAPAPAPLIAIDSSRTPSRPHILALLLLPERTSLSISGQREQRSSRPPTIPPNADLPQPEARRSYGIGGAGNIRMDVVHETSHGLTWGQDDRVK